MSGDWFAAPMWKQAERHGRPSAGLSPELGFVICFFCACRTAQGRVIEITRAARDQHTRHAATIRHCLKEIENMLDDLPDDANWDDLMYKIYVRINLMYLSLMF